MMKGTGTRHRIGIAFVAGIFSGIVLSIFSAYVLISFSALDSWQTDAPASAGSTRLVRDASVGSEAEKCSNWLAPRYVKEDDPWRFMKFIARPAPCKVRGMVVEELDVINNFRRHWALGFSSSVEDKLGVLPYMLATQDLTLQTRRRKVYLDLGGQYFNTSVTWFSHFYPLDFTEMHIFEADKTKFVVPPQHPSWTEKLMEPTPRSKRVPKHAIPVANFQLKRMKTYSKYVDNYDGEFVNKKGVKMEVMNITRFIKDELKIKADDALIVKMDIEEAEWNILPDWIGDPEMLELVDELFVEVHYHHPSMAGFWWDQFNHTREEALQLFVDLRTAGFVAHPWP